ncbi:MAG: cytidine deaminase, partial [Lachnospiraceae bacterium]|nr:cytidine deaminase [Lachnospiraceae bacterium]
MDERKLLEMAEKARGFSYSPYSGYSVGAALLAKSGKVYTGCNVENAAFTPGNCAERTAVFKAVSEGEREFEAIAIAGGKTGSDPKDACPPCGVCRQVLNEFVDAATFRVITRSSSGEPESHSLAELLPFAFG